MYDWERILFDRYNGEYETEEEWIADIYDDLEQEMEGENK